MKDASIMAQLSGTQIAGGAQKFGAHFCAQNFVKF